MREKIAKRPRKYFPEELDVSKWEELQPLLEKLLAEKISSAEELIAWWEKVGELGMIIDEAESWLHINMTRWADKKEYSDAYEKFDREIMANAAPYDFKLKKKFLESEFCNQLDETKYGLLKKILANGVELFREENVPLMVEVQKLSNGYGEIFSQMKVLFRGEEKNLQAMYAYLKNEDRQIREEAWKLIAERVGQDADKLSKLFDELKKIRTQIAKNAGFANYRDYMHQAKGRFSYSPEDLLQFHASVEKELIPFMAELREQRKNKLKLDVVRPWDTEVSLGGEMQKPFENIGDFVAKSIRTLNEVDGSFGEELASMDASGFLDLETRLGKRPGGYCSALREHGSSFIFMSAIGVHRDVETLMHEMGHALHNTFSKDEKILEYLYRPTEAAELASMSMELLTMQGWHNFYDEENLKKAEREQLEGSLRTLPWVMVIDAFQHWIYLNPEHSVAEREAYFAQLIDRFRIGGDWSGLEKEKGLRWLQILHIFEIPFYFIEYAISQLGAIAIYRNYKKDPQKAIVEYKRFLTLSYTKPLDELYAAAGIKFDFSAEYIRELVAFVREELAELEK